MHRFTFVDAQILLGLFYADKGADISCLELVSSCKAINHTILTQAEFAEAFNKLLYARFISLDENKLTLTAFGRQLVNEVQAHIGSANTQSELAREVFNTLATYKLKSMCNRSVWTQQDYQQAVAAQQ